MKFVDVVKISALPQSFLAKAMGKIRSSGSSSHIRIWGVITAKTVVSCNDHIIFKKIFGGLIFACFATFAIINNL